MSAELVYVISYNFPGRPSSVSAESAPAEPQSGMFMGPKHQDYVLGVELTRWECGSLSTESKLKTHTAFKEQRGKTLAKQTEESWGNACDIFQAIKEHTVICDPDFSVEVRGHAGGLS